VTIAGGDEGSRALVKELDSAGALPAGFGALLHAVPRERFIPDRAWAKVGGTYEALDRGARPEQWFTVVYSDRPVVTQFDDGRTAWPAVGRRPTCSASMPSVVGAMLDILGTTAGDKVLEIGTGTGFNAALLAGQTGADGSLTTVEVDSELAVRARRNLDAAGYRDVFAVCGDGALGAADRGPFDRVMATAAVQLGRVPFAWVEQTRPGGVVVAPVRADLASGPLVRFVVTDAETAVGHAVPMSVGFMEIRSQRTATTPDDDVRWETAEAFRLSEVDPWAVLGDPAARWAVAVAVPSCRYDLEDGTPERPYPVASLGDPLSGSWAVIVPQVGRYLVRQAGPRRLWDEAEAAYHWWRGQARPPSTPGNGPSPPTGSRSGSRSSTGVLPLHKAGNHCGERKRNPAHDSQP
jgi:protein-L-isoaspartate(D-aspartate) O-methyltransferase